ncbi:Tetratricopeptide repeat superfamily protein [Perilla frutescens var. hirtella]|uniref:Tetratricopeptide repeat superfamily protein n=1 Tax=Perilla frutescens var. hirtella TaxID=608512 RepID=A0AAD4J3L1_PERFH|nr:Tetratricopeptide repeat superfamily protein [Perilla frutescens var. hirtella]
MDSAIALRLLGSLILLVLYPKAESQWVKHPLPPKTLPPLCASQIALANRACLLLPYEPVPPSVPPSPPPPSPQDSHHHQHHHHHHHHRRHHHSHQHRHGDSRVEKDCCRWVKEVDEVCACGLLVHLSPFLSRPAHNYTVFVDESCQVTFSCPSRFVAL